MFGYGKNSNKCFMFHDWTKWEPFEWVGSIKYVNMWNGKESTSPCKQIKQRRICKRCGKMQEEVVSEN